MSQASNFFSTNFDLTNTTCEGFLSSWTGILCLKPQIWPHKCHIWRFFVLMNRYNMFHTKFYQTNTAFEGFFVLMNRFNMFQTKFYLTTTALEGFFVLIDRYNMFSIKFDLADTGFEEFFVLMNSYDNFLGKDKYLNQ